jgi:hypothetical protein
MVTKEELTTLHLQEVTAEQEGVQPLVLVHAVLLLWLPKG